jgi:hypothetical protein
MTAAPTRKLAKGDRVTPDPDFPGLPAHTLGSIYIVEKVNPKNVIARPETGGGRGVNFPADAYLRVQPGQTVSDVARATATPVPFEETTFFTAGEIVTIKRAVGARGETWGTDDPMVVIRDGGQRTVNVTKLGGADDDRYLRVPRAGLTKRDIGWLTERLMEEATS